MCPFSQGVASPSFGLVDAVSRPSQDASIHNHFDLDRHLNRRDIFKQSRSAALADWRELAARKPWLPGILETGSR
jgi:hypothetical protein